MSTDQMVAVFEANVAEWRKDRSKSVVVSIGFHQETASAHLPAVEAALDRIFAEATRDHLPVVNVTASAIAKNR